MTSCRGGVREGGLRAVVAATSVAFSRKNAQTAKTTEPRRTVCSPRLRVSARDYLLISEVVLHAGENHPFEVGGAGEGAVVLVEEVRHGQLQRGVAQVARQAVPRGQVEERGRLHAVLRQRALGAAQAQRADVHP